MAKLLNGDRDELGQYMRELADKAGLRDWTITLMHAPPDNERHAADVDVLYGRKVAEIRIQPNWMHWPAETLREAILHELLHCHINHIRNPINNIVEAVGQMIYVPLYQSVTDYIEYATDAIASEWAKTMPLPIKEKAKKRKKAA